MHKVLLIFIITYFFSLPALTLTNKDFTVFIGSTLFLSFVPNLMDLVVVESDQNQARTPTTH